MAETGIRDLISARLVRQSELTGRGVALRETAAHPTAIQAFSETELAALVPAEEMQKHVFTYLMRRVIVRSSVRERRLFFASMKLLVSVTTV